MTEILVNGKPVPGTKDEKTDQFRQYLFTLSTCDEVTELVQAFGQLQAMNDWDLARKQEAVDWSDYVYVSSILAPLNQLPEKPVADPCKPVGLDNLLAIHEMLCKLSKLYLLMSSKTLESKSIIFFSDDAVKVPQWDAKEGEITLPATNKETDNIRDILFEMTNAYQHPQHSANHIAMVQKKIDVFTYATRLEAIEFRGLLLFCKIRQELPSGLRDQLLLPGGLEEVVKLDFLSYLNIVRKKEHTPTIIDRTMKLLEELPKQ